MLPDTVKSSSTSYQTINLSDEGNSGSPDKAWTVVLSRSVNMFKSMVGTLAIAYTAEMEHEATGGLWIAALGAGLTAGLGLILTRKILACVCVKTCPMQRSLDLYLLWGVVYGLAAYGACTSLPGVHSDEIYRFSFFSSCSILSGPMAFTMDYCMSSHKNENTNPK